MANHDILIHRCFDLARLGAGKTSPNPLVGSLLYFDNQIIGEGWHQAYGGAHAEVNAVKSVPAKFRRFIPDSTLYVSLEPCCIFGRTPPCTNLILSENIKKVVLSTLDRTAEVFGKSVDLLRKNGVEVITSIKQAEGDHLARFRNFTETHRRPYVVLKYAQSQDGFISKLGESTPISEATSKRLVHRWRSELDAILVGTNTALTDNPSLTNRYYFGKSPIRVVLDRQLRIPHNAHLFDGTQPTLVFHQSGLKPANVLNVTFLPINFERDPVQQILDSLFHRNIRTLLVEGGARVLQSFVKANYWEEARIFTAPFKLHEGVPAPLIIGKTHSTFHLTNDRVDLIFNNFSIR